MSRSPLLRGGRNFHVNSKILKSKRCLVPNEFKLGLGGQTPDVVRESQLDSYSVPGKRRGVGREGDIRGFETGERRVVSIS